MEFPPTWHALIFGGVLVGLTVLVILTQEALAPYIIGLILVFLMNGLVDRLQRAGVPRWGGTLIAILALIVAVVAFVYLILDALLDQLSTLIDSLPEIADAVGDVPAGLGLPENVEAALADGSSRCPPRSRTSWPACSASSCRAWVDSSPSSSPGPGSRSSSSTRFPTARRC